jgi:predicted TIM-barrel fold metal-dependent hydrolase
MFDINAKLGAWPYRPVKGLDGLLNGMDRYGIDRAVVSSLSAVHFLNPQDGNEALAELAAPHRDRLVPFAVIRPNFALFEEDLVRCLDDYGMKGVVLYPNYHEFSLLDRALGPLMLEAQRCRAPVCVQTGLEDVRRQFRSYKTPDVEPREIGEFARAYPDTIVIALGLKFGQPELMGEPLPRNLYFDTSNYESMETLETAVPRFGAGRILFGTSFPLFNQLANVDKLRTAVISADDRLSIAHENAARMFIHSDLIFAA